MSKYLNKTTGNEFEIGDFVSFELKKEKDNGTCKTVLMFMPIMQDDIDDLISEGLVSKVEEDKTVKKNLEALYNEAISDMIHNLRKMIDESESKNNAGCIYKEKSNNKFKCNKIDNSDNTGSVYKAKKNTIDDAFRYYESIYGAKWYDTYAVLHDCCPTALLRMYVQYFASRTWARGLEKPAKGDMLYYIRNEEGKLIVSDFVVPKDNYVFAFPAFTDKESAIEAAKLICEDLDFKDLVYNGIYIR